MELSPLHPMTCACKPRHLNGLPPPDPWKNRESEKTPRFTLHVPSRVCPSLPGRRYRSFPAYATCATTALKDVLISIHLDEKIRVRSTATHGADVAAPAHQLIPTVRVHRPRTPDGVRTFRPTPAHEKAQKSESPPDSPDQSARATYLSGVYESSVQVILVHPILQISNPQGFHLLMMLGLHPRLLHHHPLLRLSLCLRIRGANPYGRLHHALLALPSEQPRQ
jgi:hypothetical protein